MIFLVYFIRYIFFFFVNCHRSSFCFVWDFCLAIACVGISTYGTRNILLAGKKMEMYMEKKLHYRGQMIIKFCIYLDSNFTRFSHRNYWLIYRDDIREWNEIKLFEYFFFFLKESFLWKTLLANNSKCFCLDLSILSVGKKIGY